MIHTCDHCGAVKDEGSCTYGCDDLPPCPRCHAPRYPDRTGCTCTRDELHEFEIQMEKEVQEKLATLPGDVGDAARAELARMKGEN